MRDHWAEWLLEKRFGGKGNAEGARLALRQLAHYRDILLDFCRVKAGETVVDVGCGDGLMGFGALERTSPDGRTIFLDISEDLLCRSMEIAHELGVLPRSSFVRASADCLPLRDESVDVVTTRSVLIYVSDKDAALSELRRVLRPKGRIALFETVLALDYRDEDRIWPGFGAALYRKSEIQPVRDLIERLLANYSKYRAVTASMGTFGHKDWFRALDRAGFAGIRADFSVSQGRHPGVPWDFILNSSLNPLVPTLGETINEIFTAEERVRLETHMRPLVERGGAVAQESHVKLWAWKNTPSAKDLE